MDSVIAGKMGYKKLIENRGKGWMSELSKRAAEKRSEKARARKNEAILVLDTETSVS
jgi:hypothetical protein